MCRNLALFVVLSVLCFGLAPVFKASGATLEALYSFDPFVGTNPAHNSHGAGPTSRLMLATDGDFYGTTLSGGTSNEGTVFKMTSAGVLTTLHSFAPVSGQVPYTNSHGANPETGLVEGTDGAYYGTTYNGGTGGAGTIFRITSSGEFTTLYSFASVSGPGTNGTNSHGAQPLGTLIQGDDGDFYGTTLGGGTSGTGTVFKITSQGSLTTIYTFGPAFASSSDINSHGAGPFAGLVEGTDGFYYGTTISGGTSGTGTIFRISANGNLTTLYSFGPLFGNSPSYNSHGAGPRGRLLEGPDGNFYGTTNDGGTSGTGTVFRITPAGALTTLHSFGSDTGTFDNVGGACPYEGVTEGSDGRLYGTTGFGGAIRCGNDFRDNGRWSVFDARRL